MWFTFDMNNMNFLYFPPAANSNYQSKRNTKNDEVHFTSNGQCLPTRSIFFNVKNTQRVKTCPLILLFSKNDATENER